MEPEEWIQHFAMTTVKDAAETASRATDWAVSVNNKLTQQSYDNLTDHLTDQDTAEYVYGEET